MTLNERQEGYVILATAVISIILLVLIISSALLYDIPNILVIALATFFASISGTMIPTGIKKIYNPQFVPELDPDEPFIDPIEDHKMDYDPILLRLPVSAKKGKITDVYAEVKDIRLLENSEYNKRNPVKGNFNLRGENKLLWAGHFEPHSDVLHEDKDDAEEVLKHMVNKHLSAAEKIEEIENGDTEKLNIAMKIEGIPETFLTDSVGTAGGEYSDAKSFLSEYNEKVYRKNEVACGEFICELKLGANETDSQNESIIFRTGPNLIDLKIPDET